MEEELIDGIEDTSVHEAKKLELWEQIRDLFNSSAYKATEEKESYKFAVISTVSAASVGAAFLISDTWSGLTGSVYSDYIDSSLEGDLGQLVTGKEYYKVTSEFGYRKAPIKGASSYHKGIDIALVEGTPLYAPFSGRVVSLTRTSGGGITLTIESEKGNSRVIMMHLRGSNLSTGVKVTKGQAVARSGNTGVSTGAHLHLAYQVKRGGSWVYVNPRSAMKTNKKFRKDMQDSFVEDSKLKNLGASINNPMSLTDTGIAWEGKIGTYTAGTGLKFVRFSTPEKGVRAGMLNIYNKANRIRNVNEFVREYVTGGKGYDYAYARNLSNRLGVRPNEQIDLTDERTLKVLTAEVAKLESGSVLSGKMVDRAYKDVKEYISKRSGVTINGTSLHNKK